LIGMGAGRLGQFIEFIPHPVTTGFTAGIALVIATLQLKDFFGLNLPKPARALRRARGRHVAGAREPPRPLTSPSARQRWPC
jgi:hypothetical protein